MQYTQILNGINIVFNVETYKRQKTVTVSMRTFDVPNSDIKVWTYKSELPPGTWICSLTQPEITRQITFEVTDIEYDLMKDENPGKECVEYHTAIERNTTNVDDI